MVYEYFRLYGIRLEGGRGLFVVLFIYGVGGGACFGDCLVEWWTVFLELEFGMF